MNLKDRDPILIDERPTPNYDSVEESQAHLHSLGLSTDMYHENNEGGYTMRTDGLHCQNMNPNSEFPSMPETKRINKSQGR